MVVFIHLASPRLLLVLSHLNSLVILTPLGKSIHFLTSDSSFDVIVHKRILPV